MRTLIDIVDMLYEYFETAFSTFYVDGASKEEMRDKFDEIEGYVLNTYLIYTEDMWDILSAYYRLEDNIEGAQTFKELVDRAFLGIVEDSDIFDRLCKKFKVKG